MYIKYNQNTRIYIHTHNMHAKLGFFYQVEEVLEVTSASVVVVAVSKEYVLHNHKSFHNDKKVAYIIKHYYDIFIIVHRLLLFDCHFLLQSNHH